MTIRYTVPQNSADIRKALEKRWNHYISRYTRLFESERLSGSSPPSVFVGSYNYPSVNVGPMVPPEHGDTRLLDAPERWTGSTLEEILGYRLGLVRGVKKVTAGDPSGRYIENLQEVAMSRRSADAEIEFEGAVRPTALSDGESAPFGPIGSVRSARFSGTSAEGDIQRVYYDGDLGAGDAVMELYDAGVEISRIHRCLSIGMMGKRRRLVPTRWSITATDDMISRSLVERVLDAPPIDSYKVFFFRHLGNSFSVVLFPHRWIYEMIEAWYYKGVPVFGSDHEGASGIDHPPAIAGAYFAARLAVAEYLAENAMQAGVLILREITPEYAMPVGVWQVREGVREAMKREPRTMEDLESSLDEACRPLSIAKREWLSNGSIRKLLRQRTLSEFL